MITCRACQIALPDGTVRCPMCQRNLRLSTPMMVGAAVAGVLLLFVLLAGSNRFKTRVQSWQLSPDVVVKATEKLVTQTPALHNAVGFSGPGQTTVDHWDAYRWRVSGFVDSTAENGQRVRTLYFAVVQNSGGNWRLEDLQLQNIEAGASRQGR